MIKKTILIILLLSSVVYGQYPVRDSLVVTGGVRTTERIWHKPTSGAGTFLLGSAGFSSIRGDSPRLSSQLRMTVRGIILFLLMKFRVLSTK